MRIRLSTRLVVTITVIQLLVIVALVWNSIRLLQESQAQLISEFVASEVSLLNNTLAPGLAINDRAVVQDVVSLLKQKNNLQYMVVFNDQGDEMAGINPLMSASRIIDHSYEQALQDGIYDIVSDVVLQGQKLGYFSMGYSLSGLESMVEQTRFQGFAIGLLGVILCVLVSIFSGFYITRNLRGLEQAAGALRSGRLDYRVNIKTNDEIGDVANAMDDLAKHLDETERQLQEKHAELKRETRYLQTLLNSVDAVVMEASLPDYEFRYVSQEAENLLGFTTEQWLTPGFFGNRVYPDDKNWVEKTLLENSKEVGSFNLEFRMVHQLGHLVWVRSINTVEIDVRGQALVRGLILDIMEQKTAEDRIVYLAEHDALTGLINRRRFQEELERSIAFTQRYQQQGALFFIDLDQFKYINDSYGHQFGDEYLLDVSRRLSRILRRTDILGRLGGDEFGVIIPSISPTEAQTVANTILSTLTQDTMECKGDLIHVSACIGITMFPTQGVVSSDLLAKADAAMYAAKQKGNGNAHVFDDEEDQLMNMQEKIHWEERIRYALANDRFVLYYQPVANLSNMEITHYEVLLRMLGEDDKVIAPAAFIETAERFGLIREIDRWVIKNAIKSQALKKAAGEHVSIAVNISGRHFGNTEILDLVKDTIQYYAADPRNIIFEVTETAAVENLAKAREFMDALRKLGCRFALDDFGIGFSSFHYLRNLPVDYVKIDGSFVRNLHIDKADQVFVKAMVDLATNLGITCIAEFVENGDIVDVLRELNVAQGQGYFLSRPQADTLHQPMLKLA